MTIVRALRRRLAPQCGAVLVTVALFAPVAILFASFAIDAGDAWWHQRHLQVQADAGALAAAQQFQPCDNSQISVRAQQYGGIGSGAYNQQIGGTASSNVHQLINSQTFYGQSSPIDTTVNTSDPCTAMMADVKMTEANLPFWLSIPNELMTGFPDINAQARVEIRQETTVGPGTLPVSVNDVTFKSAEAFFINESPGANNAVLAAEPLVQTGASNGLTLWSGTNNPTSVTVPSVSGSDVAVRIALSGTNNLTGNMSTDCAASGVLCFDSGGGNAPLLDVHGWSSSGTGTLSAPILRQVFLTQNSCGDQYFTSSYYTGASTSCTDNVQANIDFGASPKLSGITVSANGNSLSCTSARPAVCTGSVPVTAASGRTPITITAKQGNTTLLSVANAQSTYAAAVNGNAGPIQTLSLEDMGTQTTDVSSLQQGTTYRLAVNMGITGTIKAAQSVNDQPITLKFDGSGSQNQAVQCSAVNGGSTYADQLASGCDGTYQINQPLTCPDPTDPNNNPIDCVNPNTGNVTNQVAKGLNQRILQGTKPSTCTAPNHWAAYPNIAANDPRVVTVFVTPYGSFGGSGSSQQFPIQYFAAFYITGWADNGNGFNDPCPVWSGSGPAPDGYNDQAAGGTVVGHFISYVNTLNTNAGGGTACVPNSLGECVAVLTR